ncbi:MAG: Asp-tRNA(Asn)/Glu-tRNA(Gln) amidotransferase subunit GatC [Candidatus Binatia bacterium]|jgi:aspartyl-tRNA(Asn)/glutamyl-tRNA(Gln) amidotransferase subunit C|nr:Asp-tRNA(Asn)/Glu-tRNA(Gln) amidotransferase subunit GatC [Candidatus Binatia bacterium]|tara:strand:- start:115 stop:402 length:288 start_codon:yes stop_codon:yes gene_type:complete
MNITKEDVERVALLARLELSSEEKELFAEQLDKIFHHIEKLNQLDTENVEPLAHAVDIVNAFREDRVVNRPSTDSLLANAPAREENFFKVPKIIE